MDLPSKASFLQMDHNVYVATKEVCECYFYYQIKFSIQIQLSHCRIVGASIAHVTLDLFKVVEMNPH